MKTKISKGNIKIGKIPNSSLRPIKDCPNCASCKKICYAMKAYRCYPSAKKAWDSNSKLLRKEPGIWAADHIAFCLKNGPRFFRFNVAGDIIATWHFEQIINVALECPETKFLVFTKSFQFIRGDLPENLAIVLSLMPGMTESDIPKAIKSLPRAYAGNPADYPNDRRAKKALECHGNCENCGLCWNLAKIKKDVRFDLH